MVGWHHLLNGHELEQAPGDGEGHGSLACFSPWVAVSETTEGLNKGYPTGNMIQQLSSVITLLSLGFIHSEKVIGKQNLKMTLQ